MAWTDRLVADPVPWLLDPDTPAVRAATLQRGREPPLGQQPPQLGFHRRLQQRAVIVTVGDDADFHGSEMRLIRGILVQLDALEDFLLEPEWPQLEKLGRQRGRAQGFGSSLFS